jgi:hypothetical protein
LFNDVAASGGAGSGLLFGLEFILVLELEELELLELELELELEAEEGCVGYPTGGGGSFGERGVGTAAAVTAGVFGADTGSGEGSRCSGPRGDGNCSRMPDSGLAEFWLAPVAGVEVKAARGKWTFAAGIGNA